MDYFTIVTTAGAALVAQAITEGTKLSVVSAAVGDGGGEYYAPTVDQTALKNETWRGEIAGASISSTNLQEIDVTIVVGTDIGGFVMREAGIFAEDGTLVAVCNMPDTEKIAIEEGISSDFTLMMHIVVADPSVIDFVVNPSLDYVTRADLQEGMQEAEVYAEAKANSALETAKEYADTVGANSVGEAISYADTVATSAREQAEAYADTAVANAQGTTLEEAKAYTDTVAQDTKVYADDAAKQAVNDAKAIVFDVDLPASGWADNSQTVSDDRFIVDGYAYVTSPAGTGFEGYGSVRSLNVTTDGEMTFIWGSEDEPETDLSINVLRMEVQDNG